MKNLHLAVVFLGIFALVSCNKGNVNTPAAKGSIEGYTRVNQGNYDKLTSNHTEGGILEEGFAKDESKEGTWLKYDKEGNLIGITSYMDGKINGPSIEMNNRGQITRKQYFLEGVPHGIYGDYKFGRATKEVNFKNGVMEKLDDLWTSFFFIERDACATRCLQVLGRQRPDEIVYQVPVRTQVVGMLING